MPTDWRSFPCPGSSPRWRHLDDGHIEIEGEGVLTRRWPAAVEQWRPEIFFTATKYGLKPHWIAAIMAIESGGRPGLCARLADGSCAQNEGAGLMAILPSTATLLAGRPVTSDELLADNALSIDLGAKYLRQNLDRTSTGGAFPGGDFVYAALSYNAGSPRCGTGHVWRPTGSDLPRLPCPTTTWNVIMGCVESPPGSGHIVVNDYPRQAIAYANAALDHGFAGIPAQVIEIAKRAAPFALGSALALAGGFGVGWWVTQAVRRRRRTLMH